MLNDPRERFILAADVGGTNLSLALMAGAGGRVRLMRREVFRTRHEPSLAEPCARFLDSCRGEGLPAPEALCVSGAGPVRGRTIPLTNVPWDIEAEPLERVLGIPVSLVNDFAAVAYGVLLLDPADPGQLLAIPHPGGTMPEADPQGTILVVGAGTGLGVGFITREGGLARVHASEGGHIGLPVTGEETLRLWRHLRDRFPGPPGAEAAVSGPGIAAILDFLASDAGAPTPRAREILALPAADRPAAIALEAEDPLCRRAMELFVELYARVCAELAAAFLPTGGIRLAGGIAAKNAPLFLEGDRFMAAFERNYRDHLDALARSVPVHIVRDYAVSLYGAANAVLSRS